MDENETKALEYIQQADKKLKSNSGGLFGGLIGGSNDSKIQEGVILLERAGNSFKMAKKWCEAGDAFLRAAEAGKSMKSANVDVCSNYIEAGNCYRKVNPASAKSAISCAIDISTDSGRFSIAAKHHMTIAEIAENDCNDFELAIKHYGKAADFFEGEQASSSTAKCRLKIAHLEAQLGHYDRAVALFQQVGQTNMENRLLQYGAREHLFKALICQMLLDLPTAREEMLPAYQRAYPTLADSREFKLCQKILAAIETDDVDAYTATLKEHDSISRMEPFLTTLFLKIKKQHFTEEEDLC